MYKELSVILKLSIFVGGVFGVIKHISFLDNPIILLCYFTLISNLCCAFMSLICAILIMKGYSLKSKLYFKLKGSFLMMIYITHFVFTFVLAPQFKVAGIKDVPPMFTDISNMFVHYITPWAFIIDYLLFDTKGNFVYTDSFIWVFSCLLYAPFAYTRIWLGGSFDLGVGNKYPYFFLDYETYGIPLVAGMITVMCTIVLFMGFGFVYLDHHMEKVLPHIYSFANILSY